MNPFRAFSLFLFSTPFGPFIVHWVTWVKITVLPVSDTYFY